MSNEPKSLRDIPEGDEANWEVRRASSNWSPYSVWKNWDAHFVLHQSCEFRRIEKPLEAMRFETTLLVCASNMLSAPHNGTDTSKSEITIVLPMGDWCGKKVQLTIREIIPNAPEEPDWKARFVTEQQFAKKLAGELFDECAAHEGTKKRVEMAEAKLSDLSAAAGALSERCLVHDSRSIFDLVSSLRKSLKRCAPEGTTDG